MLKKLSPKDDEQILKLISEEYPEPEAQAIVAKLIMQTQTGDKDTPSERYHRVMLELFGKEKAKKPRHKDRDHDLLIQAAAEYRTLIKNLDEDQAIKTACRTVIKVSIMSKYYDLFYAPNDFTKKHKPQIDKDTARIVPKFKRFKNKYITLSKELELHIDRIKDGFYDDL